MAQVKHVIQYLMMVGLPFLVLLGVLHVGRDLRAPMAVHGTYTVVALGGSRGPCLHGLLADSTVVVIQSGKRVEVRLGPRTVRLEGQLTGQRLTATGAAPVTATCPAGEPIQFEGTAVRVGRQLRLDAQLRAECVACGSLTVAAARQPPAAP